MPSFIKADTHISIVFDDGHPVTVYSSSPNFDQLVYAVKIGDWESARTLACPIEVVKKQVSEMRTNRVSVEGGMVCLDGTPIHSTLTRRMLDMHNDGFNIAPMSKFLENLMENPSYRAVNELYDFLEVSKLPITEDGHFLAYKRVRSDFKDAYTGTIDNSPGQVVTMPRNQVNEDKDQTCSSGLHFCAREYLGHYHAQSDSKVVIVKIHPRDVVSIPSDYNNQKGRCCRYEVLRELPLEQGQGYLPSTRLESSYVDTSRVNSQSTAFSGNWSPAAVQNSSVKPVVDKTVEKLSNGILIATYSSPAEAERQTGIDASGISKVCCGTRNSAGGYQWRWKNPIKPIVPKHNYDAAYQDHEDNVDDQEWDEYDYKY